MSIYSEKLARLKKEIATIESKKSTKFKKHQKDMIKFIHSRIDQVEFTVNSKIVILEMGDDKKGFRHILQKHYAPNDLETIDILNLPILFKDSIKLIKDGVSNNELCVYRMLKNQKDLRLITDETKDNKLVVTSYKKS